MFSSVWWRFTAPYILILLAVTLGLTLYLSAEVRGARLEDRRGQLLDEARLMADSLHASLAAADEVDAAQLDRQADTWSRLINQRVTLIGADGTVLGESHADYREMENHLYRPEIQQALSEGTGSATRYSRTLQEEVMYAALALREGNRLLGFIRVALPLEEIEADVGRLNRTLIATGALAGLSAILLTTYVASRTVGPIRRLTEAAERMAAGDLSGRLLPTTRDEIGQLTRSFNHMAEELQEKVSTLALEQARLSTVLEHMADGVIITNEAGVIVLINTAAARILRYDEERAVGRRFAQVAYSHQLIDLWNRCYETQEEQNETVETALYGNFLHAVITPLRESDPPRYLVMLQDLTHVRRLETVRRDFISNISHELRTPLASLSLLIETLRDGAIEDPRAAQRFLTHMETEMSALTQMVEELLELSRIESGRVPVNVKPTRVHTLVHKPVERLLPQAQRKNVELNISIPEDLPKVMADPQRIHQVVTNLVHNAIKFTPSGGVISIIAQRSSSAPRWSSAPRSSPAQSQGLARAKSDLQEGADEGKVLISISDTGSGIPEEDLPRIFERFFKTDRARAQEGTGLGLAIAKHIVQGHGGQIWVKSIEGAGSTFTFSLPVASSSAEDLG